MKFVNVKDVQARLPELLALLDSNPAEEIVIMRNQEPVFKISGFGEDAPTFPRKSAFGVAKEEFNLPPDFDEVFVALDKEIWREVADSYEVQK